MNYLEILVVSLGLAMDAFAVAVCKGISAKKVEFKNCLKVGFSFGLFQAFMPIFGFLLGKGFKNIVFAIDHYIVFCLLVIIGANMIYEAFCEKEKQYDAYFDFSSLLLPAFATSIDAFSVGITFALLKVHLFLSVVTIGVVAFVLSSFGVYLGGHLSHRSHKKAKVIGGSILILLGIKILLENIF